MFETFSYLPPLSDEAIAKQVDYIVANGEPASALRCRGRPRPHQCGSFHSAFASMQLKLSFGGCVVSLFVRKRMHRLLLRLSLSNLPLLLRADPCRLGSLAGVRRPGPGLRLQRELHPVLRRLCRESTWAYPKNNSVLSAVGVEGAEAACTEPSAAASPVSCVHGTEAGQLCTM